MVCGFIAKKGPFVGKNGRVGELQSRIVSIEYRGK